LGTRRSTKASKIFLSSATFLLYKTVPEEFIYPVKRRILLTLVISGLILPLASADLFPSSGPVVSGKGARLRSRKAAAPKNAPIPVKRAIWAGNQLRSKPYRYGGGHKSFKDHGYDCSGTISYVLAAAGLINTPMSSTEFRSYGESGPGKWITIYAREGHTFAVIAGLRLDTTPFDRYTGKWAPRWYAAYRPPSGFDARHPIGL
jgi:NlpC/P60 family